jgi:hypothetical protein
LTYIPLIELHAVVPEQLQKLLLKRNAPVMLFLVLPIIWNLPLP